MGGVRAAVVQYCMFVGGRTPYKMLFSKATGRVFQQDFVPNYGQNFELEKQEAVPFRLTRNLFTFFTNFGVDGSFLTVLSLTAQVRGIDSRPFPLCDPSIFRVLFFPPFWRTVLSFTVCEGVRFRAPLFVCAPALFVSTPLLFWLSLNPLSKP